MDGDTRTAKQTNWETPATSNQPAAQDEALVGGGMAAPAIPGRTAATGRTWRGIMVSMPPVWHPSESIPRPRLPPLSRVSKAPSTQSRSRSRSRSPVARRKSPPHHSPPFRSVTPPPRHSSPSRSVMPVMNEAEAADVESGSDCNLLDLTGKGEGRKDPRCPQWPEAQGGATLRSRSVRQIDGTIDP